MHQKYYNIPNGVSLHQNPHPPWHALVQQGQLLWWPLLFRLLDTINIIDTIDKPSMSDMCEILPNLRNVQLATSKIRLSRLKIARRFWDVSWSFWRRTQSRVNPRIFQSLAVFLRDVKPCYCNKFCNQLPFCLAAPQNPCWSVHQCLQPSFWWWLLQDLQHHQISSAHQRRAHRDIAAQNTAHLWSCRPNGQAQWWSCPPWTNDAKYAR